MPRSTLIGAVVALFIALGAAGSTGAATVSECAGGGVAPAVSYNDQEIAWAPSQGGGICFARFNGTRQQFMALPASLETPTELLWGRIGVLVGLSDGGQVFSINTRARPHLMKSRRAFSGTGRGSFSLDFAGDKLATGSKCSSSCAGPIQILRPGGVSTPIGDGAYANGQASLSPDGGRVVFAKRTTDGSGSLGIWTARTDGSLLHRIERHGHCPLWSPGGRWIAYVDHGLRLVSPTGARGPTLTAAVSTACGRPESMAWSPDGQRIAFADSTHHLSVVNVRTKRMWRVHFSRDLHAFAWGPSSYSIFFSAGNTRKCRSLWQTEIDGRTTARVSRC